MIVNRFIIVFLSLSLIGCFGGGSGSSVVAFPLSTVLNSESGLTYNTSVDNIKSIVADIQNLIDNHPMTNQDGRVRFQEFGASSLDIMVMYFVNSPRWEDLINVKEDINYKIMEIVKKHKSDFAFPSRKVYLQK